MKRIAQIVPRHRTHRGVFIQRIAHPRLCHLRHELLLEFGQHGFDDDESLRCDAALPGVDKPSPRASFGHKRDIHIREHDIGVASAELEHSLLETFTGPGRHSPDSAGATRQRNGTDVGVFDHRVHGLVPDQKRSEQVFRKTRIPEQALNRKRAARDIDGMLQHGRVPGHERWRRKADDLPKGKIPRHHREHDAQGRENHVRLSVFEIDRPGGKKPPGVFRVEFAAKGAFPRFGDSIANWLSHLDGHELRVFSGALAQQDCGLAHRFRAFREPLAAPFEKGMVDEIDRGSGLFARHFVVSLAHPAGQRIHRLHCGSVSSRSSGAGNIFVLPRR
jgi:hypothetical protein